MVKSEEDAPAPPGHVGRPRPGEHFDSLVELFDLVRDKSTHTDQVKRNPVTSPL